jgi:predicted nucleic acid-binding protein
VIVVDASVVAPALLDDGRTGERYRARLASDDLLAPELLDIEVVSVWRRLARAGRLEARRAQQALAHLTALPLVRAPHAPLVDRVWELRDNLSAYDASYVALAEALGVALVTADERLSRAPGLRCPVEVLV